MKVVSSCLETKIAEASVVKLDLESKNAQLSQDLVNEKVRVVKFSAPAQAFCLDMIGFVAESGIRNRSKADKGRIGS